MANILVVDDEVEVGEVVRRVLERTGYTVTVTNSATAALDAAAREAGAEVILTKPFDLTDLIAAVRRLLPN